MTIERLLQQGVEIGLAHRVKLTAVTGVAQSAGRLVSRPQKKKQEIAKVKLTPAQRLEQEEHEQWQAEVEQEYLRQKGQHTPPPPPSLVKK